MAKNTDYLIDGLSEYERHMAKSWADNLLHNAPQTKDFFDPKISLGDIENRQSQKQRWRDSGKSLQASETSKVFVRSNVQTMKVFRNELQHIMEFAYKYGAHDVSQALSVKKLSDYIKFREQQVYKGEITYNTFREYMSKMRIYCAMSTATKDFPNVDMTKSITKASNRIESYMKEHPELVNEKHKIHAFKHGEEKLIIDNIKNEKVKLALQVIDSHCFRIENASTIHLNKEWKYDGKKFKRVDTDENKIALVSKGTQRHTVTFEKELFDKLKEYADDKGIFHISKRTIQDNVKRASEKLGLKATVHIFRATAARNYFYSLIKAGYTYEQALQYTSWKLFHGRLDITLYYLNSANDDVDE